MLSCLYFITYFFLSLNYILNQTGGIFHLLDTRFHGIAVGVGTGKILGRIHIAQLQISNYYFPVTVTVMDNAALPVAGVSSRRMDDDDSSPPSPQDMDFLLGLDMLKRFNCSIDLLEGKLKFRLGSDTLETPFLHEKDLDSSKGGTKGFVSNDPFKKSKNGMTSFILSNIFVSEIFP